MLSFFKKGMIFFIPFSMSQEKVISNLLSVDLLFLVVLFKYPTPIQVYVHRLNREEETPVK